MRPSVELPAPMVPESPRTVIVKVVPRDETVVVVIESTLLAAALMVSATELKLKLQV